MEFTSNQPPRRFRPNSASQVELEDCGRLRLEPDEQITLCTRTGAEYDVVRKAWGFYAMPSLNDRLRRSGLRPALVKNAGRKYFVLLVEAGRAEVFEQYLESERLDLVAWLDDEAALSALEVRKPSPSRRGFG